MIWVSLLRQRPEYFREGVEIGSFFGCFPFALWNGGREIDPNDQCDAGFIVHTIQAINQAGIPIRYTFTNPLLTEEELKDEFCNFCMKAASGYRNEVLVFSPLLEDYIRKNYPSYVINSTTCKEIKTVEALNEEMEKDYQYVVLDYNLNGDWDFIGKLTHPEKLEVLINATCTPNCPRRGEHYREIARRQRIVLKNRKLPPERRKPLPEWKCKYGIDNTVYSRSSTSRMRSGRNICRAGSTISRSKAARPISLISWIPIASTWQSRSMRTRSASRFSGIWSRTGSSPSGDRGRRRLSRRTGNPEPVRDSRRTDHEAGSERTCYDRQYHEEKADAAYR